MCQVVFTIFVPSGSGHAGFTWTFDCKWMVQGDRMDKGEWKSCPRPRPERMFYCGECFTVTQVTSRESERPEREKHTEMEVSPFVSLFLSFSVSHVLEWSLKQQGNFHSIQLHQLLHQVLVFVVVSSCVQMSRCPDVYLLCSDSSTFVAERTHTQVNIYKSSLAVCCRYTFSSLLSKASFLCLSHMHASRCVPNAFLQSLCPLRVRVTFFLRVKKKTLSFHTWHIERYSGQWSRQHCNNIKKYFKWQISQKERKKNSPTNIGTI